MINGKSLLSALLMTLAPFTAPALAQLDVQIESEADRFLKEQQLQREREELQRQQPLLAEPEQEEENNFSDKICFTIDSVEVDGVEAIDKQLVNDLTQEVIGQCIGQKRIAKLLQAINALYMDRGFITTRAYLPEQNLSRGKLLIKVLEGRVEKVQLNESSLSDRTRLWAALPGTEVGSVLNMRHLEQAVDQLDAPPSVKSQIKLWPGEEVGTSLVEITTTEKNRFRANISTDNDGQENTGKQRLKFGLGMDNLLSLNETMNLNYIGSRDTNALIFQLSLPFRRFNFSFTRSYSEYLSILSEYSELFGQSDSTYMNLDYMLFRNTKHKITLKSGLSLRESIRYINDTELVPQKLTVASLGVEHRYIAEKSRWLSSLNYSRGLDTLDATTDPADLVDAAPHAQFSKLEANVHFSRPLGELAYLQSLLAAQYAFDSLYGSEQVHLGGLGTVRGFIGQPFSGDRGFYLRNDVSWPKAGKALSEWVPFIDVSLSSFIDLGYVKSRAENIYGRFEESLSGMGFSVNAYYGDSRIALTLATPLHASQQHIKDDYQLSFSVNLNF
ncbi:ShlB/FhaC/HecB family hemolysin secretion/activation protein [Pseudoteredinibacter isoporae]|uniref:Hemolysin activation/secretion protein n=1 Tax=Pseudoteredinibacter isoporae TaxID=570281 RepID=A0A7X0JSX0_9GAMM|nr:ShlB/FhaC/HecB family hemolysin secretion/activation protein [Pseudoteredinibacter isoporae]MBB6521093.1 hemolysin activation/secretion protein [Pseudoteredinibacter isoporae]NHO86657.1 ShlB/FhaC/HecB family hemolysin secretion/activation protein [Pseudoteredinibacter isoporae]NIB24891.1 ShlB/FhaC/HecB family hemolysin secretion/activation protein [Pseudoteredinibacter isoporae]